MPEQVEAVFSVYERVIEPAARRQPGFVDLIVLINETTGWCLSVALWADEAALEASERSDYFRDLQARLGLISTVMPVLARVLVRDDPRPRVEVPPLLARRLLARPPA